MTRAEVIAEARHWVGTPYIDKGRSERGIDCLGLLVMIGRAFAVPHVDQQDYSAWPRKDNLILAKLDQYLRRVPPASNRPGLIGCFADRQHPGHVGIFSTKHDVLHLIHSRNRGTECVTEEPWPSIPRQELRLIALYALPGLEDL